MAMTPKEILKIDAERNHPPGTTAGDLIASINDELRAGGSIVQEGNVLIVYRAIEPGVVEHHSFNADTPKNLSNANAALWRMLKKAGAKTARTTYQNPKISQLLESLMGEFDISITEQNGDFVAEVRL
jgi:hypothetical protein